MVSHLVSCMSCLVHGLHGVWCFVSGIQQWHTGQLTHSGWPVRLHARHSCSVFTALWWGCFVVKLTFFFTRPHLCFGQYELTHLSSPQPGYRPVGTMVQIIPGLRRITDMHQVHKYPDSSISKVLTILKLQMTDVKQETAAKAQGTDSLCWDVGTLGNTLTGSVTQDPRVGPSEACAIHPTHPVHLVVCTREVDYQ